MSTENSKQRLRTQNSDYMDLRILVPSGFFSTIVIGVMWVVLYSMDACDKVQYWVVYPIFAVLE